jgi:hypothetical protein
MNLDTNNSSNITSIAVTKASTMPTTPNDPNTTVPETTLAVSKLPCTREQYNKNVKKYLEENEIKTKLVHDGFVLATMKEITEVHNESGLEAARMSYEKFLSQGVAFHFSWQSFRRCLASNFCNTTKDLFGKI